MTVTSDPRVSTLYAAFGEALGDPPDVAPLEALLTDASAMHVGALGQDFTGRDAIIGFVTTVHELTGGSFRFDLCAVRSDGDHSAVLVKLHAERPGRQLRIEMVHLVRFAGEHVGEIWAAYSDEQAVVSFWG